MGNYFRISHELLLLGVRGKRKRFPEGQRALRSWVRTDRPAGHSTKPGRFREMLEGLSPPPRLELFGRQAVPGWVVHGNQVEVDLFSPPVAKRKQDGQ
jgi:N6-adenosine-specific RNA methylase IME4